MWCFKRVFGGLIAVAVGVAVFGYVVMLLWNALIPELFKGPMLTYWQSAGLLLLAHILFHGFGGHCRHSHRDKREHWRRRWERKLSRMSPEQREKIKAGFRKRYEYKLAKMSPEARERFEANFFNKWWEWGVDAESTDVNPEDQQMFYHDYTVDERKRRWGWTPEAEERFKQAKESFKEEWKRFMAYPGMSAEDRAKFKEEWTRRVVGPTTWTPEEKEKFYDDLKRKWGWSPEAEERFKAEWQRVWGWSPEAQAKYREEWKRRTGEFQSDDIGNS